MKIANFANSIDPDEAAHNEPPHLDLHCLSSNLGIFNTEYIELCTFLKVCKHRFCRLLFGTKRVKTWMS